MCNTLTLRELLERNRSYRRFRQDPLVRQTILELIELARLCPSTRNCQPLKFRVVCDPAENAAVFRHLFWALGLPDWPGPAEGERPTGYIVILGDTRIARQFGHDTGIVAQSMLLGAVERCLGGCMIGSIDRDGLRRELAIPEHLSIELVVALGTPGETVVLETAASPEQVEYWRDAQDVHHVPKRPLEELLVEPPSP